VVDIHAHCRGVGLGSLQPKTFYDSQLRNTQGNSSLSALLIHKTFMFPTKYILALQVLHNLKQPWVVDLNFVSILKESRSLVLEHIKLKQ